MPFHHVKNDLHPLFTVRVHVCGSLHHRLNSEDWSCSTCSVSHMHIHFAASSCYHSALIRFFYYSRSLLFLQQASYLKPKFGAASPAFWHQQNVTDTTLLMISPVRLLRLLSGQLVHHGQVDLTGSNINTAEPIKYIFFFRIELKTENIRQIVDGLICSKCFDAPCFYADPCLD